MRVKKAIQKIAAFGTGMSLVGATLMGAMAADLGDYPAPFVKDGQFDAVIVVGDRAAAEDVVGAVDIGASLQFALATPAAAVGGAGGVLQGDVVEIGEPSDMMEIGERIGNVRESLTDAFLDALRSGIVTTDEGTTDYNQYLRFANQSYSINPGNSTNVGNIPSGRVVFDEDEDDVVGHYLFFKDSDTMFEYELEFEEGVESQIKFKSGTTGPRELDDLEDEQLVILGETYTIVDTLFAEGTSTGIKRIKLELLGGDVVDTLEEGECKTYNIDGVDYETCVIIISDNKNSNDGTVKFSVNGEITDEMEDGDTEVLRDGTQIGIRDILPNEAEEVSGGDIVEFFLGANEIEFEDSNAANTTFENGVKVGQEDIEDASVAINGVNLTADTYRISNIKYRLRADSLKGDVYVRPGHGLREFLDEPQGMLNNNWDIVYQGLQDTGVSIIKIDAAGDDSYNLKFTSREGLDYNVPLVDNSNDGSRGFTYGDEDNRLFFRECATNSSFNAGSGTGGAVGYYANYCIKEDDLFVLTDDNDETGLTHVLSYESIDTTNNKLTFTDLGTGQREITYDTTRTTAYGGMTQSTTANSGGEGALVVGGNTFRVYVMNNSNGQSQDNRSLSIDLDASGTIDDDDEVFIIVDGGGMLDLGTQCTNGIVGNATGRPTGLGGLATGNRTIPLDDGTTRGYTSYNDGCGIAMESILIQLISLNQEFDENGPNNLGRNENISINISTRTGNELDLEVLNRFQGASGVQVDTRGGATTAGVVGGAGATISEAIAAYEYEILRMQSLQDEDIRQGLSTYGVFFEQSNSDNADDADELTIEYPLFQRGVVVYVTAGKVASSGAVGEGSLVTLNQINYGSAKLASEVAGQEFKQNMILVGGPCINAAAAKLMGSSEPLCGEKSRIKPGEAIIKLFENDGYTSMLVAGYDAADTRRGSKVVSQHSMYANDFVGDSVVVKGTSMTDIKVMQPV